MRFFFTFFWIFLLSEMVTYVVSSMNQAAFHFETGLIVAVVATILVFAITLVIPANTAEKH